MVDDVKALWSWRESLVLSCAAESVVRETGYGLVGSRREAQESAVESPWTKNRVLVGEKELG
jgi:hypothetical protein